jgi:hypothetical protein
VETARRNAGRVRGRKAPVECTHARAEGFDYGDATVVYLYHPFARQIMDQFLERLDRTRTKVRPLRIVYANAVHDDALAESGWLRKQTEWPADEIGGFPYKVTFWQAHQ